MVAFALTEVVLPVFAVVAVGWGLARWGRIDLRAVTTFLLYVAIPALLLDSLTQRAPTPAHFGRVALGAIVVCTTGGLVGLVVSILLRRSRRGLVLTSAFMNSGNFGLPFALLAWGEEALVHAVTFYVSMALMHSTAGIWIAQGSARGYREMLRLPMAYAAIVGLGLGWSGWEMPGLLVKPIGMLAGTAIPLMLVSLGYTLKHIRPASVGTAAVASVVRIGGGLLVSWAFVTLTGTEGLMRNVILLSGSMPAAVLNVVLSDRYDADREVVSTTVLLSTLIAAVTVPTIIAWVD